MRSARRARWARRLRALGPLACLVLSAACGSAPVAHYRDGTVSREQYESWLRFRRAEDDPEGRKAEIEEMVLVETLAAAARERGLEDEPALRLALQEVEDGLLANAYHQHVAAEVRVSDAEVEALLEEHPDAFHRPRKVRLRNLFKEFPPGAGPAEAAAVRAEMAALEEQLRAGADFAELARRESDSQTRFQGGLIGNVEAGRLRPEIDSVAMRLEPGEISAVIETEDGLTLLKCDRILEEKVPTREEALGNLETNLRRLRARKRWEEAEEELQQAAGAHYDVAAARDPATPPSAVVLRFAGGEVTRGELPGLLWSRQRGRDPAGYGSEQLRNILEQYVVEVQAAERARGLGLDEDPQILEQVHWKQLQALAAEEMSHRVRADFEPPTESEVRAAIEAEPQRYERLPHYDLAVIHFTLDGANPRPQYEEAQRLLARIRAGDLAFRDAARTHSDYPSAARGGALGWISRRQLASLGRFAWETVQAMHPGEVSDLVHQRRDLWIFELRGFEPARPMTFEEAAGVAENQLGTDRLREIEAGIEARLRQDLAVELAS